MLAKIATHIRTAEIIDILDELHMIVAKWLHSATWKISNIYYGPYVSPTNCCLLKLFSAAVLVLITVQVLFAILAYSMQDQIGGYLQSGMLAAMAGYQDDLDLRFITDEIQSNLQCCGADNYRDWEINIYYNCSAPGVLACGVPATCCVDPLENGTVWNSQCGVGAQLLDEFTAQSVIFLGGCLGGISRWIDIPNDSSFGGLALELPGVSLFEPRWALVWGARTNRSEGSFGASLCFRFGYIQIHASVVQTTMGQ
uniref:Tetraspanin-10 n=1 Tax=Amphiprion percula TaxID=161767 RepID=A0A3P8S258_AMPPE